MKVHTTNYINTFIEIAEDCPIISGEIPPNRGKNKSVASIQYDILSKNSYKFTSDEVFFQVYVMRKDLTEGELTAAREQFFSKGQPCFRASPLTKRYGWGIHSNKEGKVALFGAETEDYQNFVADKSVAKKKAMRSKRA